MEPLNGKFKPMSISNQPVTRRSVLQLAAGLGVSFSLPALDLLAAKKRGSERATSMILLWMNGGPSQLESWDPHPGTEIGGPTSVIKTAMKGLEIGADYPYMAEEIQHLSVIRSLVSKEGDHERGTYFVKTGYRPDPTTQHPSLTALLSQQLPDSKVEIPQHISLGGGQWPARGGYLGNQYDAFRIFEPGRNIQNLRSAVDNKRQKQRVNSLEIVSGAFANRRRIRFDDTVSEKTRLEKSLERARVMMNSDQLKAFKIDTETAETKSRYGDSRFGRGCLVARRLVETGVRSVEVTLNGFDSHANNFESQSARAKDLDPAFAALIQDLRTRDLLESTIVLCIGEFGRTPRINGLDGRDHWPTGFSCVIGGGGLNNGLVIGKTDPTGKEKDPEDPIRVQDLYATILHRMGLDPAEELMTPIGRPMAMADGQPIERLLPG